MSVVHVRECFLEFPLLPEVFRVLIVRAGHSDEIFRDFPKVRASGDRNRGFGERFLCQGDVFFDELAETHAR